VKARLLWLPVAAAVGILIYQFYPKSSGPGAGHAALLAEDPDSTKCSVPVCEGDSANKSPAKSPGFPTAEKPALSSAAPKPLAQITPKTAEVRAAIAADPHTTPELLIKFSIRLFERVKEAAKSEQAATSFFGELQTCALEKETVESVQAYCLLNAKRLAKSYPALSNEYHRLESQSDPRALRLMNDLPL
jgi:hypothetical protein